MIITQTQIDDLVNKIYKSLMSNPDFDLGDMPLAMEEAKNIVDTWVIDCNLIIES
jgi:hypothetical protein